jgi:hypothetical protein
MAIFSLRLVGTRAGAGGLRVGSVEGPRLEMPMVFGSAGSKVSKEGSGCRRPSGLRHSLFGAGGVEGLWICGVEGFRWEAPKTFGSAVSKI